MFTVAIALWSAFSALAPSVETYRFQNASAEYVMSAVAPAETGLLPRLIPASVSWGIEPEANSVTLRGPKEELQAVLPVLKQFDVRSPRLELKVSGRIPSVGYEHAQTVQLTAGGSWKIEDPNVSLELQIKVFAANREGCVIYLENRVRSAAASSSFRIKKGETVVLTPRNLGKESGEPRFELKVTLSRITERPNKGSL